MFNSHYAYPERIDNPNILVIGYEDIGPIFFRNIQELVSGFQDYPNSNLANQRDYLYVNELYQESIRQIFDIYNQDFALFQQQLFSFLPRYEMFVKKQIFNTEEKKQHFEACFRETAVATWFYMRSLSLFYDKDIILDNPGFDFLVLRVSLKRENF